MKSLGLFLTFLICSVTITFGQEHQQGKEKDPDEQIIVNKKYDENGNLIQYDSTYVHQWSSDSTFQFNFQDDDFFAGKGFPDLQSFMNEFFNDSAMGGSVFPHGFGLSPFDDEDFFSQFRDGIPDSLRGNFSFNMDSTFRYFPFDSLGMFPHGFVSPDLDEWQKQFNDHFSQFPEFNSDSPGLGNKEQQEEWKKMMEKHQKEMEEFRKKWEQKMEKEE
jgi:hypothetical protein